jgi:hypothetical protein
MKTTLLMSALGLSVALNVSLAWGQLQGAGTGADQDLNNSECLLDRLELDDEQRARLSEMRDKMRDRRTAFWRRSAAIKAELAEAISTEGAGRERLDDLLERYANGQAGMQRAVADHLLAVNAMLRSDQREEFRILLRTEMFRGIRSPTTAAPGRP